MTRAMGQSLARLAEWQVAALTVRDEGLTEATELVPVMADLITYVWRRHLAATVGRAFATKPDELAAGTVVIGFADLVGYTALTRQVDTQTLTSLVDRFEAMAADTITELGGRVVKTVGDEVMFVVNDSQAAAEIAARLLERGAADDDLPDLRIGMAYGPVVARLGDVYGEPVNLASRLTSVARPGSILVDRELAAALADDDRWQLRRVTPRPVRGYALLAPTRLRRVNDDGRSLAT